MNLVYGGFQHDAGDAEIMISREGLVSELGRMYAIRERWNIQGRLHATDTASVNAAVAALMAAYSVDRQDIYLAGSSHIMRSADTINGTRVVAPPSFPRGSGAENSTFRTYTLAVEAEFAYIGESVLLSWNEALSFRGTGGPAWGLLECLNGPPQLQMFQQQTVCHCKQAGSATCVPDSAHRNDYGFYWQPPQPVWPQWEHTDRRDIVYDEPSDLFGKRVTHWSFEFSANVSLGAFPHATSGVISHLG